MHQAWRTLIGSTALLLGIVGLDLATMDAADPIPDSEFKALVEQDAKNIVALLSEAKIKKTADRSVKSSSLMIAAYAQSRMGKNAADDAKLATLRDTAIKLAKTDKKMLAGALPLAKTLSPSMAAAGNPSIKPVDLLKETGLDLEELMYQFKKTSVGGLGIEEEVKANSKKLAIKPEAAIALARRTAIVAEFCETLQPQGGFGGAKTKKDWDTYNKEMKTAAEALAAAAKANKPKDLQTAFTKLDGSCVQCHNKFK
jgi:hypothetical protein